MKRGCVKVDDEGQLLPEVFGGLAVALARTLRLADATVSNPSSEDGTNVHDISTYLLLLTSCLLVPTTGMRIRPRRWRRGSCEFTMMATEHTKGETMQYDDFITRVAMTADLPQEQAASLTRATLATLADRISGGEAQDLAAQLPAPLQSALVSTQENAQAFSFEEFVERVAEAADMDRDIAERGVDAVFITLREAVTPGEFDDVLSQLPSDFQRLGTRPWERQKTP